MSGYAGNYDETRKLNLSATNIDILKIKSSHGDLKINGKEGLDEIQVTAEIRIDGGDEDDVKAFMERYMELDLEKSGSRAYLTSFFEDYERLSRRVRHASIDLMVYVPSALPLSISNGSGSVEIADMGADIYLEDGSGAIEVRKITGNIEIDDGSGDIDVKDVNGEIDLVDGSGSLYLENITGDIIVDDGSGTIEISEIDGNVEVSDGSGSIRIDHVTKDVTIKDDGSGSVKIRDVQGSIHREDD
jgi:hypothetical protein